MLADDAKIDHPRRDNSRIAPTINAKSERGTFVNVLLLGC